MTPPAPTRLRHEAGDLFFTDAVGREVYLAGSHTWTSVQDVDGRPFEWGAFVGLLRDSGANLTRLWATDHVNDHGVMSPSPFMQLADGRFDLSRLNPDYFETLRARVEELGANGIYASVMMFNGWSVHQDDTWPHSPWREDNNVNGIDGTPETVMGLGDARITALQEAYVRAVVKAVGDLPNVLWEVCNESVNTPEGWAWQRHMLGVIRAADPHDLPAGVTAAGWWTGPRGEMADRLRETGADWTSPDGEGHGLYGSVPPAADGGQVSLLDTDHIWGVGGMSVDWVWQGFTRGHNLLQMDNLLGTGIDGISTAWQQYGDQAAEFAGREGIRQTRMVAEMVDLTDVREAGWISTTGFALADPDDGAFIVYAPEGGDFSVDLSGARGLVLDVRWMDVSSGEVSAGGTVTGDGSLRMEAPGPGGAVLVLTPHAGDTGSGDTGSGGTGSGGTGGGGGDTSSGGSDDDFAPATISFGSGRDVLVLEVSQDFHLADSTYTVSVGGVQVGGSFAASALHASGQHDTLTLRGDWGAGPHTVTVEHTNDRWEPGVGDSNLYVTGATFNGVRSPALGDAWYGGSFTVTGAAGGGTTAEAAWPVPTGTGRLVTGTDGADTLTGGAGADVILGGEGNDRIVGRAGADRFGFEEGDGQDRVVGFVSGTDALVFRGVDAGGVQAEQVTRGGKLGLDLTYGEAGDVVFLVGVTALQAGDLVFL